MKNLWHFRWSPFCWQRELFPLWSIEHFAALEAKDHCLVIFCPTVQISVRCGTFLSTLDQGFELSTPRAATSLGNTHFNASRCLFAVCETARPQLVKGPRIASLAHWLNKSKRPQMSLDLFGLHCRAKTTLNKKEKNFFYCFVLSKVLMDTRLATASDEMSAGDAAVMSKWNCPTTSWMAPR